MAGAVRWVRAPRKNRHVSIRSNAIWKMFGAAFVGGKNGRSLSVSPTGLDISAENWPVWVVDKHSTHARMPLEHVVGRILSDVAIRNTSR